MTLRSSNDRKLVLFSLFSLSSYDSERIAGIILVKRLCILSNMSLSLI